MIKYLVCYLEEDYGVSLYDSKEEFIEGFGDMFGDDLSFEEATTYAPLFDRYNLANITFVAPTDGEVRIAHVTAAAKKFIYLVAYAGITGSGKTENLAPILEMIKQHTTTPIYVGFGVNESTAKEKVLGADGVIVGSSIVDILLQDTLSNAEKIKRCCEITRTIKYGYTYHRLIRVRCPYSGCKSELQP